MSCQYFKTRVVAHAKIKVMSKVVSQVLYYNQTQQYPQIQKDYKDVQKHVQKTDSTDATVEKAALESIPMFRRVATLPEKIQDGDTIPALGLASLALINLPEDMRDVKAAGGQLKSILSGKKFEGAYDYKNYQHDFSFFRGTLLEPLVDLKKAGNKERAQKLLDLDKTLLETSFGQKIQKLLNVEIAGKTNVQKYNTETKTWETVRDVNGIRRKATAFEGSAFGKLTARALNRTTLLGVAALSLLEIPKVLNAMGDASNIAEQAGNTAKQTIKSGVNLASVTAGIAYGGAIGSKYGGPLGSLVGMGAGAVFGSLVSKNAQAAISG